MPELYGPTGVTTAGSGLTDSAREHLEIIIRPYLPDELVAQALEELNTAVKIGQSQKTIQKQLSFKNLRKNIKNIQVGVYKLTAAFNSFDSNTWLMIDGGTYTEHDRAFDALNSLHHILRVAETEVETLPKGGGRPLDHAKVYAAAYVAFIMKERLGIRPATSPGSLFTEIVTVISASIDDEAERKTKAKAQDKCNCGDGDRASNSEVGHIVRRALRLNMVVDPSGTIEFDPFVN